MGKQCLASMCKQLLQLWVGNFWKNGQAISCEYGQGAYKLLLRLCARNSSDYSKATSGNIGKQHLQYLKLRFYFLLSAGAQISQLCGL